MRNNDGLVKSGRIEGRTGQGIGPISVKFYDRIDDIPQKRDN